MYDIVFEFEQQRIFDRCKNRTKTMSILTYINELRGKRIKENIIFKISKETPYPIEQITDFICLTGLNDRKTYNVITRFNECGITNLEDVNRLIKMGILRNYDL